MDKSCGIKTRNDFSLRKTEHFDIGSGSIPGKSNGSCLVPGKVYLDLLLQELHVLHDLVEHVRSVGLLFIHMHAFIHSEEDGWINQAD
jgi:hypothetical protein